MGMKIRWAQQLNYIVSLIQVASLLLVSIAWENSDVNTNTTLPITLHVVFGEDKREKVSQDGHH